jgi:two-component system NtrC family sensor kinase
MFPRSDSRTEDYEIVTANSGQEGLEVLEQNGPFQLIVSDYRMPSMNGVDFLSEVCRRWPDTDRIILSGYADTAAIVSAINEGRIYKFIAKPWNDVDLLHAIREALNHYELRASNRRLLAELTAANDELKSMNDHLYGLVDERVKEVLLQSRALHSFQNVLDSLPIGFLGADDCGMIVQCNSMGAQMLDLSPEDLIGIDLATALPREILVTLSQLECNSCVECQVDMPTGRFKAFLTRISVDGQKALVVPDGLAGEAIPLGARLIAIADFIEKSARSVEQNRADFALLSAKYHSGTILDPQLVTKFSTITRTLYYEGKKGSAVAEVEIDPYSLLPGMTIARDVESGSGVLLMQAGKVLDTSSVALLQSHSRKNRPPQGIIVKVIEE